MINNKRSMNWLKSIGPGIIFAGTCIGVSHLVQSTRAGANYGFALLWAVLLANLFKFPFFEFAPRYVAATGENLLLGYRRLGKLPFVAFLLMTVLSMIPIQAAVTLICTGLMANLLNWPFHIGILSSLILLVCMLIILLGRYPMLDKTMKWMVLLLSVATITAFLAALFKFRPESIVQTSSFKWDPVGISFLVALMGWMPTTIDIAVWHSFWSAERMKQTQHKPLLREALFDFHLGYWGTMVMAVLFLSLGAFVMHGSEQSFSDSAVGFTAQVVRLYTESLGGWSYPIIALAAGITMFSTTLACLDAFPRVFKEAVGVILPEASHLKDRIQMISMFTIVILSVVIISFFINNIKALVDFATTLSFLSAPIFAFINLKVVTSDFMPISYRPSKSLVMFSWLGIVFLSSFGLLFLYTRFV